MKRILLLFVGIIAQGVFAQSAGFNNTFVILSIGGSLNLYYDLNANTANYDFNGQTLGTFCQGSQELVLKGGENNIWKCGGCDLTGTGLNYRVYLTGGSAGSFNYIGFGYAGGGNNGCGGADQKWDKTNSDINLISGLAAGNYTLEVYCQGSVTCNGGTIYASNNGQNYKAYFTVNATSAGGSLAGQNVCYGSNPADVALTGQTGNVVKWQRSTVADFSSNVTDINSTATTLSGSTIGAITQNTYLRAEVKSGVCASAYSSVAALTLTGNTWTAGGGTSDWFNPANWSCGMVPGINTDVTIPNLTPDPVISGAATAKSLTLDTGALLTITGGNTITIGNALTNNGEIIVENNGALVQQTGSIYSGSGTATVYRYSNALKRLDYTMWSAPVTGQNLLDFSPLTWSASPSRFYTYGILPNGSEGYLSVDPATTNFAPATGYLIRTPNTLDPNNPDYNSGNATYVHQGRFTGALNNGTINITGLTDHYMAVGNPYASPISIQQFLSQNSGIISGTIYLWRKRNVLGGSSSSYVQINNTGYVENTAEGGNIDGGIANFYNDGDEANWILSPGQGFIVGVQNAGNITFNNSMRVAANATGGQPFFKTNDTNDTPVASKWWLNLSGANNLFSQALVAYMPQATLDVDYSYDGALFTDVATQLYSKESDTDYSIQARPQFTDTDVVKLGFAVPAAGQYTLSLDRVSGVFAEGQSIYIKDNQLGTTILIGEEGYTFTSDWGTFNDRFEVVYQTQGALGNGLPQLENAVVVYNNNGAINISAGNIEISSITVYDTLGRRLYAKTGIDATQATISSLNAAQEVLVIEVNTVNGKVTKKIVY